MNTYTNALENNVKDFLTEVLQNLSQSKSQLALSVNDLCSCIEFVNSESPYINIINSSPEDTPEVKRIQSIYQNIDTIESNVSHYLATLNTLITNSNNHITTNTSNTSNTENNNNNNEAIVI